MAQQNFLVTDDGRTITAKAETVITAGDLVYASRGTTATFGSTVSETILRGGYEWDDIHVTDVKSGTAAEGDRCVGVALIDAANGSQITFATEGVFLAKLEGATTLNSGALVRPGYNTTTAGVAPVAAGSTAFIAANSAIVGRSLTGSATQGDYLLFKLRI